MNKVRIIGLGIILTGFLISYFFNDSDVFVFSGMMIGLGIGWTITGRLYVKSSKKRKRISVETK